MFDHFRKLSNFGKLFYEFVNDGNLMILEIVKLGKFLEYLKF